MIYSPLKSTPDKIIEFLALHDASVSQIHTAVHDTDKGISIQAVYDAVRTLVNAGVVIKYKKSCSLSAEWKKQVANSLLTNPEFPRLEEGDGLKFSFHTFVQLDLYWKHINALFEDTFPNSPIFFFVSHQIWIYLQEREESQDSFLKSFSKGKRSAYTLVGNNSKLDSVFKKRYEKYLKVELEPGVTLKEGSQLTVCGDLVVCTKIPSKILMRIDALYKDIDNEPELRNELQKIFAMRQLLSVNIYRKKDVARKLRKRIVKNMYISGKERIHLDI